MADVQHDLATHDCLPAALTAALVPPPSHIIQLSFHQQLQQLEEI